MDKCNATASIGFLEKFHLEGHWVLTAIYPEKTSIKTATFEPKQVNQAAAWVEKQNTDHNVYFMVNEPIANLTSKAKLEDVQAMAWLHVDVDVDVDPEPGRDIVEEQNRISQLFGPKLPKGVPEPTFVIFSGGGFQGFWKLKEPLDRG